MKNILLCALCVLCVSLTACGPDKRRVEPPSLGGVTAHEGVATERNQDIQKIAAEAHRNGLAAGSAQTAALQKLAEQQAESLRQAQAEVEDAQKKVNDLASDLQEAHERIAKLKSALLRRVGWLAGLLGLGVVIYQGAAWGKYAHPSTAWLPGPVTGALAVIAYIAVLTTILTFWTSVGNWFSKSPPPPPPPICLFIPHFSIDPDDTGEGEATC